MKLIDRIAHSNKDLERTVQALRLINTRLEQELSQLPTHSEAPFSLKGLLRRLYQAKIQEEESDQEPRLAE